MRLREETNLLRMFPFFFSFDCLFLLNHGDLMALGTRLVLLCVLFCFVFYSEMEQISDLNST